jgi:hypothetical protein
MLCYVAQGQSPECWQTSKFEVLNSSELRVLSSGMLRDVVKGY